MYRCFACDNPPVMGHHEECPVVVMTDRSDEQEHQHDERINIASGEDVELEYA